MDGNTDAMDGEENQVLAEILETQYYDLEDEIIDMEEALRKVRELRKGYRRRKFESTLLPIQQNNDMVRIQTYRDLKRDSRLALAYLALIYTSSLNTAPERITLTNPKLAKALGFGTVGALRGAIKDYKNLPPDEKPKIINLQENTALADLIRNKENW